MYANHHTKKQITYRSCWHFNEQDYINDLLCAPLHVSQVFNDVEDQMWFHNRLFTDVINQHVPFKKRIVKSQQFPYMNGDPPPKKRQ